MSSQHGRGCRHNSTHTYHRSAGIPTSFPFQSNTLQVDGGAQSSRRGLLNYNSAQGKYPAHVRNIRNAATNLVEIIADAARARHELATSRFASSRSAWATS